MIDRVGIVVPVHDEEDSIEACVESLVAACDGLSPGVESFIVVVLDACTDRSASRAVRALGARGECLAIEHRSVGRARRSGAERIFERAATHAAERLWLATTDADSTVPGGWLRGQLELAAEGVDGIAGTIEVAEWSGHAVDCVRRFLRFYEPENATDAHDHVHGTNLGIRGSAYLDAGGFLDLATGEDHALWNALRSRGHRLASTRRWAVTTSARRQGRAPRGFADFLVNFGGAAPDTAGPT